ncbi:hypothetical protein LTR84_001941 [Exophiala bonariae]|uniref:PHD-type domain-containing protein n=1 Tax=Exophiala bonariae TaxID=1690606 RepID=A0AAV9NE84_9EURO|nr:hypothetical protein LTR84_001941 [Exophiala bonariae]
MPRKRTRDEMEASEPQEKKQDSSLLHKIRNMWEFASVMQFIFMFGKAIKIDEDFDIEDFENECLSPGHSEKLEQIGLTLLKWISSHRGLNYDIWDEYTRRQYLAKAPQLNPYGDEETPRRFRDFDIFTKIRILHQLTVWTFWNPDRLREKMVEHPRDADQIEWRIEEFGYDRDDRQYYLLDDNRFYRRTEPALPSAPAPKKKAKANTLKAIAARRRASKRRKIESETPEAEDTSELMNEEDGSANDVSPDPSQADTFGGYKWECLAITLKDYEGLCLSFAKSKDPNEKALKERIEEEVIPIIQNAEERHQRKMERRQRELMMMEKMVGAKRSSRLADKQDKERREAEAIENDRKQLAELAAAHREQERQEQMEQERQYRMMTREQRIKDREYKRLLKMEELERDAAEERRIAEGEIRGSDRNLKQRIEKNKKELEDLSAEEEWTFDCSRCGKYGKNYDDGAHSVACERCNVWQHSKCLGISKAAAEKADFIFVCQDCKQKEEDAKKPKVTIKFKVGTSSSPAPPSPASTQTRFVSVDIPKANKAGESNQTGALNETQMQQSSPPSQSINASSPTYPRHNGTFHHYSHPQTSNSPSRPISSTSQQSPNSIVYRNHNSVSHAALPQPLLHRPTGHTTQSSSIPSHPSSASTPQQNGNASSRAQTISAAPSQVWQGQTPGNARAAGDVARLPSPVLNRPTMSPTQGNMDVGPVAGVPQKSSVHGRATNGHAHNLNGVTQYPLATPRANSNIASAETPNTVPLSGLSPKKQQTPVAFATTLHVPKSGGLSTPLTSSQQASLNTSAGSGASQVQKRSVSGTLILPPIENLRPSPEQMRNMSSNEPVPTPSKQSPPQTFPNGALASASEDQAPVQQSPAITPTGLGISAPP